MYQRGTKVSNAIISTYRSNESTAARQGCDQLLLARREHMAQASADSDKHGGDVACVVTEEETEMVSPLFRAIGSLYTHPPSDTVMEINQAAFEAASSSMLGTSSAPSLPTAPSSGSMDSVCSVSMSTFLSFEIAMM